MALDGVLLEVSRLVFSLNAVLDMIPIKLLNLLPTLPSEHRTAWVPSQASSKAIRLEYRVKAFVPIPIGSVVTAGLFKSLGAESRREIIPVLLPSPTKQSNAELCV